MFMDNPEVWEESWTFGGGWKIVDPSGDFQTPRTSRNSGAVSQTFVRGNKSRECNVVNFDVVSWLGVLGSFSNSLLTRHLRIVLLSGMFDKVLDTDTEK